MQFDKAVEIREFTFERAIGPNINDSVGFKLLIGGLEQRDVTIPAFSGFPSLSTAVLSNPLIVSGQCCGYFSRRRAK
ncbi:MAG: Uncharacterised protein [Opitutia bacterium UBA7350]|nr:MAG: Uncharacterised protein [Opitutae bacterium UBA7350]